jgi:hypothetical protein
VINFKEGSTGSIGAAFGNIRSDSGFQKELFFTIEHILTAELKSFVYVVCSIITKL